MIQSVNPEGLRQFRVVINSLIQQWFLRRVLIVSAVEEACHITTKIHYTRGENRQSRLEVAWHRIRTH